MNNPFQNSQVTSVCDPSDLNNQSFSYPSQKQINQNTVPLTINQPQSSLYTQSPIALMDFDKLSQRLIDNCQLCGSSKFMQQVFKQIKMYTLQLEKRNIQIACQLQKQKQKSKQLLATISYLRESQQQKKIFQQRLAAKVQIGSKLAAQVSKREATEADLVNIKLQNNYLKQLILIANQNYQKLQIRNKQLICQYAKLQQEHHKRQSQLAKKTQQVKSALTSLALDKNVQATKPKIIDINMNNTINYGSKGRKQHVEDAYRQIFMKTLKSKKQNIP